MPQKERAYQRKLPETPPKRMARYPREWSMVIEDDECTDVRGKNLQFSYNNKVIAKIHMNRDHYRAVSNVETELFDEAAEFRLKQGIVSIDRKIAIYYNYVDGAESSLVVADIRGKRLLYCNGIPLEKVQHNATVSYKADKRKWEGDVWENLPCGWGCWYDENGQLIFEGFRVKHDYVCYGTDYLPDGKIKYQGMMCGNRASGFGSVAPGKEDPFDEWLSGRLVAFMSLDEDDNHIVNSRIEKLTLADQTGNDLHNTICISCFRKLRELTIGSSCFRDATGFECCDLPELNFILIGEKSFTAWTKWTRPPNAPRAAHFLLQNCPKLQSLSIARYSFSDFASFTLRKLPELITLTLGEKGTGARCFAHAPLSITGGCLLCFSSPDLPTLDHITFGRGCFQFSQHSTIASSSFVASPH